jgi:C4-dicarboxylate-specific signal transduction histidine kinase
MSLSIAIAAAALLVSLALVLYTRRQTRAVEGSDARQEAIELADVRGQVIQDLENRLGDLEREQQRERDEHANKIELLEKVISHVRTEAAEAQRMLVVGFRGAAIKLLGHLEADPAEVDEAVDYLRDMLNGEAPPPARRHRRAA